MKYFHTLYYAFAITLNIIVIISIFYPIGNKYENENVYQKGRCNINMKTKNLKKNENIPKNYVAVFSGRWKFLRIQFPYLFQSLKENGGVIDVIEYLMVKYDETTENNLVTLQESVNHLLKRDAIMLIYFDPSEIPETNIFSQMTIRIFNRLGLKLVDNYIKLDDDVIYIHMNTFNALIENQNSSVCTIHMANIAGANWRSSYIHQEMGLYNNSILNTKQLTFEFNPFGDCGWKSSECGKLALDTFLHLYKADKLYRYMFKGVYSFPDRTRYSINAYIINRNAIDIGVIMKMGSIDGADDEEWLTEKYQKLAKHPHCVIGEALVVHFSYHTTLNEMLDGGLLEHFEDVMKKEVGFKLPALIIDTLG